MYIYLKNIPNQISSPSSLQQRSLRGLFKDHLGSKNKKKNKIKMSGDIWKTKAEQ